MNNEKEKTITFSLKETKDLETRSILLAVYQALSEKGYNPLNQIVGYILSEDPTYITNYKNARALICKIDRDELMNTLIKSYLGLM
ncbi:MAG: IreB family regulatory phosphoprotein [Ruminococcaceae bacterium]|nr:IreB family regulatory phosphoprotein [Oscillospiraceae bacterium]